MARLSRLLVLVWGVAVLAAPDLVGPARAQESRSPSILEFFGIKPAKPSAVSKKPSPKSKIRKKSKLQKPVVGRKKAVPTFDATLPLSGSTLANDGISIVMEPLVIPDKLPDAKTVLVVGDFMAAGVFEGLVQAFERDAGVVVTTKANGSSGFIRDDFYNWPQEIGALITETKPAVVAVMLGTNDRQPLRINGEKAAVRGPDWIAEYETRVARFADTLKQSGVPVVWIGLPPLKQPSQSADVLAFNDIYRKNTERISGKFVDIWDGFLDVDGVFSINGFDYIGQPARLRASDGTNLTASGKRKVAFYAEKPLRLALGELGVERVSVFNPFNLPGPRRPEAVKPVVITRLPPVSLFDPSFDGDTELLGGGTAPPKPNLSEFGTPESEFQKSAAQALYVDGIAPSRVPGRIDGVNGAPVNVPTAPMQARTEAP